MFQSISWQSYWITMGLLMAGYYGVVYLLYFRSDFSIRFPGKKTARAGEQVFFADNRSALQEHPQPYPADDAVTTGGLLAEPGNAEQLYESCLDELRAFFEEARRSRWTAASMVSSLQTLLKKYPSLKTSPYKESLSHLIITQCEHHCSLDLGADELGRVWQNG